MERIRQGLTRLPAHFFSILALLAILWLTLAPKPLGEHPPPLFPGADKLAHGIIFGGFVGTLMLDYQRRNGWRAISWARAINYAVISSFLGIVIEFAQANMHLGRGFELLDMTADVAGAFAVAINWVYLQVMWSNSSKLK